MAPTATAPDLALRGVAFRTFAQLLGPDPVLATDRAVLADLAGILDELGDQEARAALGTLLDHAPADPEVLRRRWVYWFDTGRVPPYESSNTLTGAGGHTARMADIAGFYAAFGLRASGDRPDHLVAELEFASHVTLMEAEARGEGRTDDASVCADALRVFLRDHLGGWLEAFSGRVEGTGEQPWTALAASVAAFVRAESARRNVIPVRTDATFPADPLDLSDEDDELPVCGGEAD